MRKTIQRLWAAASNPREGWQALAGWARSADRLDRRHRRWMGIARFCENRRRASRLEVVRQRWASFRRRARRQAKRLEIRMAKRAHRFAEQMSKPWAVPLSSGAETEFKQWLWNQGYLSPNFTRAEAGSKDGTPIPESLRANAQYHAFALERVRNRLGNKSMTALSWYRSPSHNRAVSGASQSQHMQANATDWSDAQRSRLGATAFDDAMHAQFSGGGRGTIGTRHIRHVDNGSARTWRYA